jgi:hypothetical protein
VNSRRGRPNIASLRVGITLRGCSLFRRSAPVPSCR